MKGGARGVARSLSWAAIEHRPLIDAVSKRIGLFVSVARHYLSLSSTRQMTHPSSPNSRARLRNHQLASGSKKHNGRGVRPPVTFPVLLSSPGAKYIGAMMPRLMAASTSKIRSALGDPHVQLLAVRVICNQDNAGVTRGNRNLDGHNAWG